MSFLLLRTLVPAIRSMSDRVLPTVPVLSKTVKTREERKGEVTLRPQETRTPEPRNMVRETEGKGDVLLTRSARVVGSNNELS